MRYSPWFIQLLEQFLSRVRSASLRSLPGVVVVVVVHGGLAWKGTWLLCVPRRKVVVFRH